MPETLPQLEKQRGEVFQEIAGLGDFRPGSITSFVARCGKASCACHRPGHPGHGPNFRLTRKVLGKTVTETFSSPAALRKAEREVAEFHRFQALSHEWVEVSEKICLLRPVEGEAGELSATEKNGGSDPGGDRARSRSTLWAPASSKQDAKPSSPPG